MRSYAQFVLLFVLVAVPAFARPINDFTVQDGFGSYAFTLAATEVKLFFYTYQNKGFADMRSNVFTYKPKGPAPIDSPVAREEIAKSVMGLFFNDKVYVDVAHSVDLPSGITCYPMVTTADGSSLEGLAVRFTIERGAIQKVETAWCSECRLLPDYIKDYEAQKTNHKKMQTK